MNPAVSVAPAGTGIELRGDNRKAFASTEHECVVVGPADTGKTFSLCLKVHTACSLIPKCQVLIARKFYSSLVGTIVKTYLNTIIGSGVRPYGGESPSRFIYPNGSTVWLGGMDNPTGFLSGWYDYVLINQTEEISLDDWEMVGSRCTGRNAVVKYPQLLGDPNPSSRKHWILERAAQGKMRLLHATHKDNPQLYDSNGNITPDGEQRIGFLRDNLTGVRRQRLFEGLWISAEGAVFPMFNPDIHIRKRSEAEMSNWYICVDQGFTNPAAVLLVGCDADQRWHVFREFYKRGLVESEVADQVVAWNTEKQVEVVAVDEAAASLVELLKQRGCHAMGGKGKILDGIYLLQNRMNPVPTDVTVEFPNGRPRLTFDPDCKNTINELESHVWKPDKDIPLDKDNHSIASLRYLEDVVGNTGAFTSSSTIHLPTPTAGAGIRPRFVPRRFVPTRR